VAAASVSAGPRADFDGDGRADIAIGAPGGTVGGGARAGYVSVVYGDGATATFSQNTAGVPGAAEANDKFGHTVVPVDLDGDSYTDLVVGTPGERIGQVQAGMLIVLWGGPDGLGQATAVDTGARGGGDVGAVVTAGDFDGDRRPGLVVSGSFAVRFLDGIGRDGKPAEDSWYSLYDHEGMVVVVRDLSSGDVNGDGITDLVVTVTDVEEGDSWRSALYLGGTAGLTPVGILNAANGKRLNGQHTAVGDVNGDGYGDIVVGHGEEFWSSDSGRAELKGGAVGVAYGGPRGLSDTLAPVWVNQDSAGVPGVAEPGDAMGTGLAVADADGDGYADVLAGVPGEDFDGLTDAGSEGPDRRRSQGVQPELRGRARRGGEGRRLRRERGPGRPAGRRCPPGERRRRLGLGPQPLGELGRLQSRLVRRSGREGRVRRRGGGRLTGARQPPRHAAPSRAGPPVSRRACRRRSGDRDQA
jgi:hypothetical protein